MCSAAAKRRRRVRFVKRNPALCGTRLTLRDPEAHTHAPHALEYPARLRARAMHDLRRRSGAKEELPREVPDGDQRLRGARRGEGVAARSRRAAPPARRPAAAATLPGEHDRRLSPLAHRMRPVRDHHDLGHARHDVVDLDDAAVVQGKRAVAVRRRRYGDLLGVRSARRGLFPGRTLGRHPRRELVRGRVRSGTRRDDERRRVYLRPR